MGAAVCMPRSRPNSRVKDLPDIALLATVRDIDIVTLRKAIEQTFKHRATYPVPASVPGPPDAWASVYARIAESDGLKWCTLVELTEAVQTFLNPVLAGASARWGTEAWTWQEHRSSFCPGRPNRRSQCGGATFLPAMARSQLFVSPVFCPIPLREKRSSPCSHAPPNPCRLGHSRQMDDSDLWARKAQESELAFVALKINIHLLKIGGAHSRRTFDERPPPPLVGVTIAASSI